MAAVGRSGLDWLSQICRSNIGSGGVDWEKAKEI